jgi:hypothetical protein
VVWAAAEITGVDNTYVRVRYLGEPARWIESALRVAGAYGAACISRTQRVRRRVVRCDVARAVLAAWHRSAARNGDADG